MKSIAESMHNFDRENFQRVAAGLPEMQDEQAVKRQAAKTAEIFNELFRQLLAVFPALASKHPRDERDAPAVASGVQRKTGLSPWSKSTLACALPANRIVHSCHRRVSLSPGANRNQPYPPDCRMQWSWSDMVYQYCRTRGQYPDA